MLVTASTKALVGLLYGWPIGIEKSLDLDQVAVGVSVEGVVDVVSLIELRGPLALRTGGDQPSVRSVNIPGDQSQKDGARVAALHTFADADEGRRCDAKDPAISLIQNQLQAEQVTVEVGGPF